MVDKTEFKNCSWAKEEIITIQNLKEIKMPVLGKPMVFIYKNYHICIEKTKVLKNKEYYLEIFVDNSLSIMSLDESQKYIRHVIKRTCD